MSTSPRSSHRARTRVPASLPAPERPIGVFDSGLGGLTVARQLRRALPHEDLIYLGDTARVPYGTKSPETVRRFACEAAQFLVRHGVKAVVVACNTATAWALPVLQQRFGVPVFGVVEPGVATALARSHDRRVGVIATPATIRSDAYGRALRAADRRVVVTSRACPLLVPLVEEGWQDHPVTEAVLREYLSPMAEEGIDTLVLGCTHYPMLKRAIRRVVGRRIALVDSAAACAADVRRRLAERGLLVEGRRRRGRFTPYVTDDVPQFAGIAARLLRVPRAKPSRVELPAFRARG
jgi:glutamate racemase